MEGGDLSFLLVDNGSTDKSHEILQTVAGRTDGLRSIRLSRNEGYGGGILAGLATCTVDLVGWTHADLQCDPMDARRALVEAQAARKPERVLVKGTREGRPWMDSMFSRGMAAFESRLLGVELSEINAQPTVFSRGLLPSLNHAPMDFRLDLFAYAAALRAGFEVRRIPVRFPKRTAEEGSNDRLAQKLATTARLVAGSNDVRKRLDRNPG